MGMWKKQQNPVEPTNTGTNGISKAELSAKPPMIHFIFDDPDDYKSYYDNRYIFKDRGFKFTTALRTDYVGLNGKQFTYDMAREMQTEGFEFAFHGTKHNYTVSELTADINAYLVIADAEKLDIKGYIGANGLYDERIVYHDFFNRFNWARLTGGTDSTNIKPPYDYFKNVYPNWIDDLTTQAALDRAKASVDVLATKGTGVMNFSMHWGATQTTYLEQLLDYILSKGIKVVTTSEAYEEYGAVIEYYGDNLNFSTDLTKRLNGNDSTAYDSSKPHFVLMKDGTVLSNYAPVKRINPIKNGVALTANSAVDDFGTGLTIVPFGTTDDPWTFPDGAGTLYNFNFGRSAGEQFQLYKASGHGGIYYRETKSDGTWSNAFNAARLGIFRPVPTSPTATGKKGDFSADSTYAYFCIANNSWIRVAKDNTWV